MTDDPRRVYLVPEDVMQSWRSKLRLERADQPQTAAVMRADGELSKAVRTDTTTSDHNKALEVNQKLADYLVTRRRRMDAYHPPQPPPQPSSSSSSSSTQNIDDVPLGVVAKTYRPKAVELLRLVSKNPRLEWDDRQRVTIDGRPIPGSNIVDLLTDVTTRRKAALRPPGFELFRDVLQEMNTPRSLINNPVYLRARSPAPVYHPTWSQYQPLPDSDSDDDVAFQNVVRKRRKRRRKGETSSDEFDTANEKDITAPSRNPVSQSKLKLDDKASIKTADSESDFDIFPFEKWEEN